VGTGAGLSYSDLGTTHHAIDDIGILRTIPNLRIFAPCDSNELSSVLKYINSNPAPTYIRIGKKGEFEMFKKKPEFSIESGQKIFSGNEIALLSSGTMINRALEVYKALESLNISVSLINCATIKPIPKLFLQQILNSHHLVVTFEEHSIIGGFGSAVAEIQAEESTKNKLLKFGLADTFPKNIGDKEYTLKMFGFSITESINKIIKMHNAIKTTN